MKRALRLGIPIALAAIALGLPAWAAFAPIRQEAREQVYEIPKGTWARRQAGEQFDLIPDTIHMTLGVKDVLVMKNHDDVPHLFGPVLIMPEQSFQLPFRKPASYIFTCPLHTKGQLTIVIDPEPEAGWRRLVWRTTAVVRVLSALSTA